MQDPLARFRELQRGFAGCDIANQMAFLDMTVELPDVFLEKVDRSTMAASLEVRVPFLDHDLVDYSARLHGDVKVPRGRKKWLLKEALRGIVPDDVLDGAKTGFSVPFGRWLQTSLSPLFFDHLSRFTRQNPDILDAGHITTLFKRTGAGLQDHSHARLEGAQLRGLGQQLEYPLHNRECRVNDFSNYGMPGRSAASHRAGGRLVGLLQSAPVSEAGWYSAPRDLRR